MSEQCCGKPRTSPFCPECGKQMTHGTPLHELRKHCVDKRKTLVTSLKNKKREMESELKKSKDTDREYNIRSMTQVVAKEEQVVLKWTRWIDALDAILSPQEKEKTNA